MRISFLHTADVHVATFDALMAGIAPQAQLTHHVDASLLDRARSDGLAAVRDETLAVLRNLAKADAVVCTCSTLGPLADALGLPHVLRIDRPMMEDACQCGENIIVALCLDSTRDATLALLDDCASELGQAVAPRVVRCTDAWARFESGDMAGYADQIAAAIRADITALGPVDCIVLAQASMQVATDLLGDLGVPVLSSPLPAARRAITLANRHLARE